MEEVLVTGAAGFIGYHMAARLLGEGVRVTGIDNLNSYYDVSLKEARLTLLAEKKSFAFHRIDIEDTERMESLFKDTRFGTVVHLAAQAGVRYSLENPRSYVYSNLVGFLNVLEGCRKIKARHLVFASSSSVYGANRTLPFSVGHNVDHPLSLYAATKKSNELMAHVYASLYGLPCTGLRFFTVYGPWGRPDMALFRFTKSILEGKPIEVYNYGDMRRDFTYIDDIVDGVRLVMEKAPAADPSWSGDAPDPGTSFAPYKLYNIGNSSPVDLLAFIAAVEDELGKKTEKLLLPMQPGDVPETFADIYDMERDFGFRPAVGVVEGIRRFVRWYREYYRV
jgi:UDP-glucuronate 4-epimerase